MAHKLNLRKLPTYSALNFLKNMLPNFRDYQLIGKNIYLVFPSKLMKHGGHFVSSTHHQFENLKWRITLRTPYPFDQRNIGILPIFHHMLHDVSYRQQIPLTLTRYELSAASAQCNLLVKVKLSIVQCMMHVVSFRQQIVVTWPDDSHSTASAQSSLLVTAPFYIVCHWLHQVSFWCVLNKMNFLQNAT